VVSSPEPPRTRGWNRSWHEFWESISARGESAWRSPIQRADSLYRSPRWYGRATTDSALQEGVEYLVVGEPLNLDGSRGPASARASSFARKLAEESDLPVEMTDETLTSVEAEERLRQAGIDPRRHPEKVDSTAAQILLQQYLNKPSARSDD
jgi:putative transcription antitermination factor YqgF